uniref:Uncharacterized protein n=1 Tax=Utricularia reniformis TaxID=192314 RepID=A0A1Y0AZM8_9LAMI|nr:hypothetical protein AEK19_MT0327 [Utricularia reniformis]ART30600.1 hypothetical protein AEK19_MT0327 [Utricularia reniformis]
MGSSHLALGNLAPSERSNARYEATSRSNESPRMTQDELSEAD